MKFKSTLFLCLCLGLGFFLTFTSCSSDDDGPSQPTSTDQDDDGVLDKDDADRDGDGLIEIFTIEDLDAIREDIGGLRSSLQGINSQDFEGYELMNDLDFNSADSYASGVVNTSYTTGEGWDPIGNSINNFSANFEGGGYTISNLFIDRPSENDIGLFARTSGASINDIGLEDVNIAGNNFVGSLVAQTASSSTINNSYTTGSVTSNGFIAGGLVGFNLSSTISNSYTTVSVTSSDSSVGGLVGNNNVSSISNSYAMGNVTGTEEVGGLVGVNNSSTISNSYATGSVMGSSNFSVGGLVGLNSLGTVTDSYWDTVTSGQVSSGGGTGGMGVGMGKTTSELQMPTSYTGIYENWNIDDPWDFGTSSQYPVLKNMPNGIDAQR